MALHHLPAFASSTHLPSNKTHQHPPPSLLFPNPPPQFNLSLSLSSKRCHRSPLLPTQSSSAPTESTQQHQELIPDRRRLIAQNIPWNSTADDIRALFKKHGTVTDIELSMYNKFKNRGLAFVTMGSEEEALAALTNLDSYELEGRIIKVEFSRSLKNKPSEEIVPTKRYDVFVGNLAWRVRSEDLRELFSSANENLLRAEVVYQSNARRPTGYGFVSFGTRKEAEAAIAAFDGKELMGRTIRLGFSKKDTARIEKQRKYNQPKKELVEVMGDAK